MLRELSQLSIPAGLALFVLGPAAVSALFALLVRRTKPIELLQENNEFATIMYPTIALVYGVFLAFAVVIVWQRFTDAEESTYREVAALSELWRDTEPLPPEVRDEAHRRLLAYVRGIGQTEWPAMTGATADAVRDAEYEALWQPFYAYQPQSEGERVFFTKALDQLNNAGASRHERLMYSASEMHPLLWSFLLFGGVITVAFSYFFGTKHAWTHALMSAALAALIGYSLLLIVSLQYPFAGPMGIRSDPYQDLLQSLGQR